MRTSSFFYLLAESVRWGRIRADVMRARSRFDKKWRWLSTFNSSLSGIQENCLNVGNIFLNQLLSSAHGCERNDAVSGSRDGKHGFQSDFPSPNQCDARCEWAPYFAARRTCIGNIRRL